MNANPYRHSALKQPPRKVGIDLGCSTNVVIGLARLPFVVALVDDGIFVDELGLVRGNVDELRVRRILRQGLPHESSAEPNPSETEDAKSV